MRIVLFEKGKDGGSQIIHLRHMRAAANHNPDLLDFGRYCEDLLHKTKYLMDGFSVIFEIKGRMREFAVYTRNEEMSRVVFNYFNGGKYELDMGYDEVEEQFYIVGVVKE